MAISAKKQQPLVGPHHCATLGRSLSKLIFANLRMEAERRGGRLTVEDLQRLELVVGSSDDRMTQHYAETYNACTACMPGADALNFGRDDLLKFYLDRHLHVTLPEIFPSQVRHGEAAWSVAFRNCLGAALEHAAGAGIKDELTKVYFDIAAIKGRAMTASDLAADPAGNRIVIKALNTLSDLCRQNGRAFYDLLARLNDGLPSHTDTSDDLHVSKEELARFLDTITTGDTGHEAATG